MIKTDKNNKGRIIYSKKLLLSGLKVNLDTMLYPKFLGEINIFDIRFAKSIFTFSITNRVQLNKYGSHSSSQN